MTTPRVSVLMTAYNREPYIAEAIESVLAQTFTDFELLIVDDGSADGTVAIARGYERRDPRIRVVVNDRNLGDYANRNHAASLARGEFLKYHDSDDVMYAHCLEVLVASLDRYPEAGLALSRSTYWPGGAAPMLSTPRQSYQREYLGSGMFGCGPSSALFRRSAFAALGGFDDNGAPSDYLFWLRACAQMSVVLAPTDLFYYRTHEGQELQRPGIAAAYARADARGWSALCSPSCPLTPAERELAKRHHAIRVLRSAWWDLRGGAFGMARYRVRHSGLSFADWLRYVRPSRRHPHAGTPDMAGTVAAGQ